MYRKNFVCLCKRIFSPIHTIFSIIHSISDMNKIYKFHDVGRIFTIVRACKDGCADKQTECINTSTFLTRVDSL